MKRNLIITLLLFFSITGFSQIPLKTDSLRKDALNVFMDVSDYIRKEIPFVNYVRDIREADVYIISTHEKTGSGGYEYSYFIVGQGRFSGMADTLRFITPPDETTDGQRVKSVNTLKMGLMRYVAKTPLGMYIKINFSQPLSETVTTDKWNSWVFRGSMQGYIDAQKSYKSSYLSGNISANRVTKEWKINIRAVYSYSEDKYDLSGSTYTSYNDSKSFNTLIVKSINDHWSYGGSLSLAASSYNNFKLSSSLMPGIEYDIFPYSQSTRHQFRILYKAGYNYNSYMDTTVYDKIKEDLWRHSLSAAFQSVQKWGSVNISLSYSNYLHDWSKNNLSINSSLDLRIAKGLTLSLEGGASVIHDQLSLIKGVASTEEVLLRRRQLETQYEYFFMVGITYTFGSIYNNVVNPRFGN